MIRNGTSLVSRHFRGNALFCDVMSRVCIAQLANSTKVSRVFVTYLLIARITTNNVVFFLADLDSEYCRKVYNFPPGNYIKKEKLNMTSRWTVGPTYYVHCLHHYACFLLLF